MKTPDQFDGRALSESLYSERKVSPPSENINIFGPPSLGNHYRDAKNLAALLRNMKSGMDAFADVFQFLYAIHGPELKQEFYREVAR